MQLSNLVFRGAKNSALIRPVLVKSANLNIIFLFLNQNICCENAQEQSQWPKIYVKTCKNRVVRKIYNFTLKKCVSLMHVPL